MLDGETDIIEGGVDDDHLNGGARMNSTNDIVGFNYGGNPNLCGRTLE